MSQENRATSPQKGPVAPAVSALEGGCRRYTVHLEGVTAQGGYRSYTLSPGVHNRPLRSFLGRCEAFLDFPAVLSFARNS